MVESVGNAPTSTWLQGKCIACLPRPHEKLARRLGAAPSTLSFGGSAAQAGARRMKIGAVAGNRTRKVAVRKDLLGKEPFCC